MTLAYFSVWYRTVSGSGGGEDDQTEVTTSHLPCFQLQNGMGTIAQRSRQACLRVSVMTPESHGDNYYYHLLMLYLPWRQEPRTCWVNIAQLRRHSWLRRTNSSSLMLSMAHLLMKCSKLYNSYLISKIHMVTQPLCSSSTKCNTGNFKYRCTGVRDLMEMLTLKRVHRRSMIMLTIKRPLLRKWRLSQNLISCETKI